MTAQGAPQRFRGEPRLEHGLTFQGEKRSWHSRTGGHSGSCRRDGEARVGGWLAVGVVVSTLLGWKGGLPETALPSPTPAGWGFGPGPASHPLWLPACHPLWLLAHSLRKGGGAECVYRKHCSLRGSKSGEPRTSLAVQWLRLRLPVQGVRVPSLVGKLRSHMPRGHKNQNIKKTEAIL